MAHVVREAELPNPAERNEAGHESHKFQEYCLELVLEILFVAGSAVFVCGSIAFWPEIDISWLTHQRPLVVGCRLFDAGALLFLTPTFIYTLEMVFRRRTLDSVHTVAKGSQVQVIHSTCEIRSILESVESERTWQDSDVASETEEKTAACAPEACDPAGGDDDDWNLVKRIAGQRLFVMGKSADGRLVHCRIPGVGMRYLPPQVLSDPLKALKTSEIIEQCMYMAGSIIFTAGTLIWDPEFVRFFGGPRIDHTDWLAVADVLFMAGSFMFTFAAYNNALQIYSKHVHKVLRNYAIAVATCYEFGGFCYIAGVMGFIPARWSGCNSNMEKIGTSFFIMGSVLYLVGSFISFSRTVVKHEIESDHLEKIKKVQAVFRERLWLKKVKETPDNIKDRLKQLVSEKRKQRLRKRSHSRIWTQEDDQIVSSLDGSEHSVLSNYGLVWDEEDEDNLEAEWARTGFWSLFTSAFSRVSGDRNKGQLRAPLLRDGTA
eukprot:TRINITY_DN62089_c0_g1_i1.p1 TRINITY_DN62089_c0_g1~~TRINITY_DN62089_c0_g1_i1.p1  ORF type:complete len:489 (-),score=51.72 TRINITY_DN62089_c0_g1_i1:224-1690(-)